MAETVALKVLRLRGPGAPRERARPGRSEGRRPFPRVVARDRSDVRVHVHQPLVLVLPPRRSRAGAGAARAREEAQPALYTRLAPRFACIACDAELARELLEAIPPVGPLYPIIGAWLRAAAFREKPPLVGPPPLPPGAEVPRFLRWFFLSVAVELEAAAGDLDAALGPLGRLDAEGCTDVVWLERAPVLEGLRADPRSRPARDGFAERAAAVVRAYHAPLA